MNDVWGMDPEVVADKRSSMQAQVDALSVIASDLFATTAAAHAPHAYGIDSGERTVAPWSLHHVSTARSSIISAQSAATALLQRLGAEAAAQHEASGNGFLDVAAGTYGVLGDISWWRRWISWPRTILELPAAVRMLAMQGSPAWATGMNVRNWWLRGTSAGSQALRQFTLGSSAAPWWLRSMYVSGNKLKPWNLINPSGIHSVGRHAKPPAWISRLHVPNAGVVSAASRVATVAGKGFGVLGAVGGVANIATGVSGMMDGEVSSDDAWAVADGLVGTVTSIGSLAPPPVGLVFAGAGLAYTAGRWLFGEDENGNTGLDHIGNAASATVDFVSDAASSVGDFVDDVWPW
ncbi:hypothetical protein OH146_03900 [Salinibacterium sp. SYSU T00001]|uniref:hypothetical protein n=1 Tax=Homoserinimonas sedimenticola TaxID=2986805 RepID=UPI002236768A|nr:hypothetical protein [Salinibacterium sedimenticola]MCW4384914.1 hypothetical protein [Salinibacterium sedimenticola]